MTRRVSNLLAHTRNGIALACLALLVSTPALWAQDEEREAALAAALEEVRASPVDPSQAALQEAYELARDPAWTSDDPLRVEAFCSWARARHVVDRAGATGALESALAMGLRLDLHDRSMRDVLVLLTTVRHASGDPEGTLTAAHRAFERTLEFEPLDLDGLACLEVLAPIVVRRGAYDLGILIADEGLAHAHALLPTGHPRLGGMIVNAVEGRMRVNDHRGAIQVLERELPSVGRDDPIRVRLFNSHAIALDVLRRSDEALVVGELAVAESDRIPGVDAANAAVARDTLGVLYSKQGRLAEASDLREQLALAKDIPPDIAASNLENHAYLLLKLGELERARGKFWDAADKLRRTFGYGHPELARLLTQIAIFELRSGDASAARAWIDLALEAFELSRLQVEDPYTRAHYHEAAPNAIQALLAAGAGDVRLAWQGSERSTGWVTLELCAGSLDRGARAEWSKSLRAVHRERFRAHLAALRGDKPRRPELLASKQADLQELLDAWAASNPWLLGARAPESIQAQLAADQAVIGWLVHQNSDLPRTSQYAWILRSEGEVQFLPLGDTGDVYTPLDRAATALVAAARAPFGPGSSKVEGVEQLAERLVHPLLPALEDVRELVVCPSDLFLRVPLELLPDAEGAPLLDRFDISYAPSAAVWSFLTQRVSSEENRDRALLVGDPPYRPEHLVAMEREAVESSSPPARRERAVEERTLDALSRLPASRREVEAIATLFPEAESLVGNAASEPALVRLASSGELARFGTLHFATHARIDSSDPSASLLVLDRASQHAGSDGCITVAEIAAHWRLDADLVVLSACETAGGRRASREGLFGFAQTLFSVGARSVVASNWQVDDEATRLLMLRFHELQRGAQGTPHSKARALAEAKRWLRAYEDQLGERPFAHPSTWAAFVLLGASD